MKNNSLKILSLFAIIATLAACGPVPQATQTSRLPTLTPSAAPITQAFPATQPSSVLPQSDADVPRVSPAEAKAAFDRGEAIIVDVRSMDAYAAEHIQGAILIPLSDIGQNPTGLGLDKSKWIITYCT